MKVTQNSRIQARMRLRTLVSIATTVTLIVSATYVRFWYYTQKLGREASTSEIAILASFFTIPSIFIGLLAGLAFERYCEKPRK